MNTRPAFSAALTWSAGLLLALPAFSGPTAPPASPSSSASAARPSASISVPARAAPSATRATKDDARRADELFIVGNKLMAAGKYGDACPAYEQSFKLDPSVNTGLNLAECHEALGRTATAYLDWLEAARLAQAKGKADKAKKANDRAKALVEKLSTLKVTLPAKLSADATRVVLVDDEVVDASWTTTPHAIDPGTHYVEVRAEGKVAFRTKVLVAPESDAQSVTVPELSPVAPVVASASATVSAAAPSMPPPTPGPVSPPSGGAGPVDDGGSQRLAGWSFVVTGAVFALGAGGTWLASRSAYDDWTHSCDVGPCDVDAKARTQRWSAFTWGGLGFSVAALGTGLVLLTTAPSTTGRVEVRASAGAFNGIVLKGAF